MFLHFNSVGKGSIEIVASSGNQLWFQVILVLCVCMMWECLFWRTEVALKLVCWYWEVLDVEVLLSSKTGCSCVC